MKGKKSKEERKQRVRHVQKQNFVSAPVESVKSCQSRKTKPDIFCGHEHMRSVTAVFGRQVHITRQACVWCQGFLVG
jgi:hypothetical protein